VHAKCNDKDMPRNSRSPKNGKPSHSVVVRNKVTNGDRTVILSRLLKMIELTTNQKTNR
jgi:hypothetical protein